MNMTLEDTWNGAGGEEYSDIWGYAAPNGTEVAIIGSYSSVHFLDVTAPSNVELIATFDVINLNDSSSNTSLWRDFKTYGTYAYACAQVGSSGLLIFDLSDVPNSVQLVNQTNAFFNGSHNIFIDEAHGRLYTAGANTNSSGTNVYDIATDPVNPVEIGDPTLILGYIHDIYVRDHIAYCSHGNDQTLTIYDFTDADNPVWLKDISEYPEPGYNHSSWLDASGTRLVFADETHGQSLKLVNPTLNNFQTTNFHLFKSQLIPGNSNSIAHNPFILGDLAFISYYHDGVQVFDISDTNDIVKVAYFDTYANGGYSGYEGCWGVYPFLPSGRIIASDITNGLFVLSLTGSVLPLEFLNFEVRQEQRNARLQWKVSAPEDGDIFVAEYSRDGTSFESIGTKPAGRDQLVYSHLHSNIGPGVHYYRIKSVLADQSEKYTHIRTLEVEGKEMLDVFPTLISSNATINIYNPGQLTIFDASGKVILQWYAGQPSQRQIDMRDYPSGLYYVQLKQAGGRAHVVPVTKL